MYADPKRVRDNRMMLRFSDYEIEQIHQLAQQEGEQPSTMARTT